MEETGKEVEQREKLEGIEAAQSVLGRADELWESYGYKKMEEGPIKTMGMFHCIAQASIERLSDELVKLKASREDWVK